MKIMSTEKNTIKDLQSLFNWSHFESVDLFATRGDDCGSILRGQTGVQLTDFRHQLVEF